MTVSSVLPIKTHTYTGAGVYGVTYPVFDTDTVFVRLSLNTGGMIDLVAITDFTVALLPEDGGAEITVLTTDYDSTGVSLEIRRILTIEQTTEWDNGSALDMPLLTQSFDKVIMLMQQISTDLSSYAAKTNWRGSWLINQNYTLNNIVEAPNGSWYVCIEAHFSDAFDSDLVAGKWLLVLNTEYLEQLTANSAQSASESSSSAISALASQLSATSSKEDCDADVLLTHADAAAAADSAAAAADSAAAAAESASFTEHSVETMTDLQALGTAPHALLLRGRSVEHDGGEGFHMWKEGDSRTEVAADTLHGLLVPKNSDPTGLTGGWKRTILSNIVDVRWFGAKGDGVFDSTAAIQAAVDSGYKRIYFPAAVTGYLITSNIIVPRGVILVGDGYDVPGILCKTSLADIVYITMQGYTGAEDLRIYGDLATQGTLVELTGGTYVFTGHYRFKNVRFGISKIGTKINSVFDTRFNGCDWIVNQYGLDMSPLTNGGDNGYFDTVSLTDCHFNSNVVADIKANPAVRGSNLVIANAHFNPGAATKIWLSKCYPVLVENTHLEGGATPAVHLTNSSYLVMNSSYMVNTSGFYLDPAYAARLILNDVRTTATDIIDAQSSAHMVILKNTALPSSGNVWHASAWMTRYWDGATVNGVAYDINKAPVATFVPTLYGSGTAGSPTYTNQTFRYRDNGGFRYFSGRISISNKGGMVGDIRMALPGLVSNAANCNFHGRVEPTGLTYSSGKTNCSLLMTYNTQYAALMQNGDAAGQVAITGTNIADAFTIFFSGFYELPQ